MFRNLSIRKRMLIIFTTIAVTGGVVQLVIAGTQIQAATLDYFRHDLETHALIMASSLTEPLHHYLEGEGGFPASLAGLRTEFDHRYVILDPDLKVIGFSAGEKHDLGKSVPLTEELAQLGELPIGSSIRHSRFYVATPVQYEGDRVGYVIISESVEPAYAEARQRWMQLILASLPVIGLVIAASLWISSTISRPIQDLRDTALKMAEGALETRVQVHSRDEVGALGSTFNYMAGQIHALMKTQHSFVSNAAHELRTPLMTLKLRIEALQDAALPERTQQTYLREIRQEIDHMAHLVTSLLVLARIDEGRHHTSGDAYDLGASLHDIGRHWRIEAARTGLRFETHIPPNLPALEVDGADLRLILDNLLGNALKYTPQGCITLAVEVQPKAVVMRIQDTGIGFPPEHASALFERFYRTDTARSQSAGSGLGLAIASGILDQYGATITARSDGLNQGSTFEINFPIERGR